MRRAVTLRMYLVRTVLAYQHNCGSDGCAYVIYFGKYPGISCMAKFIIIVLVSMCQKSDCHGYIDSGSFNGCVAVNGMCSYYILRKNNTVKNDVGKSEKIFL